MDFHKPDDHDELTPWEEVYRSTSRRARIMDQLTNFVGEGKERIVIFDRVAVCDLHHNPSHISKHNISNLSMDLESVLCDDLLVVRWTIHEVFDHNNRLLIGGWIEK